MYALVHRGAGSSVCMELRRFYFNRSFHRSQCLVLSVFPFLQKEGTQTGKPCTWMQMKQLSTSSDDVAGELPVTSHNSHVTLLTNLGQFRVLSHLSHPIIPYQVPFKNSSSPEHA